MTISAKILADSISPEGIRLTTMQLRYPRFIHSEFMTHRLFSRNASSSRAIPVKRLIADVLNDPAIPIHWGKNQKGMQAHEEHNAIVMAPVPMAYSGLPRRGLLLEDRGISAKDAWLNARDLAVRSAEAFDRAGYAKQLVNRLLEPFAHINVVCTATEWDNFYKLRRHPDAQPEIKALADAMWEAQQNSVPFPFDPGFWHLPYVTTEERLALPVEQAAMVSAARCARVSYQPFDGEGSVEKDLQLAAKLMEAGHWSPFEHSGTPDTSDYCGPGGSYDWCHPKQHRNFRGWRQHRAMVDQ